MTVRTDDGRRGHRHLRGHRRPPPPLLPRHRRRRCPAVDADHRRHARRADAGVAHRRPDRGRPPRRARASSRPTPRPLGTGQMCDSVRVALTYDGPPTAPATLVAKLPAADPTSRATAMSLRSYEKEVRFYQELAPALPMRTPRVLPRRHRRRRRRRFVLLLEDLAPAEQGDQLAGCSVEVAAVAVAELVSLHAPRWGDPALRELDVAARRPRAAAAVPARHAADCCGTGFRERYAADLRPTCSRPATCFRPASTPYLGPTAPRTVSHGDYRLDNLLFAARTAPVTVVDWQTCGTAPAPSDVAYFLGAGLRADDRRRGRGRTSSAATTPACSPPASTATTGTAAGGTTGAAPWRGCHGRRRLDAASSAPTAATRCSWPWPTATPATRSTSTPPTSSPDPLPHPEGTPT